MRNSEYQFVGMDADELVQSMVSRYEELTGVTVYPASPEKLFIQWVAAVIVQERAINNYTGNQNLPSRAEGQNLDALAELFYMQERPTAKGAVCTVRFFISEAQAGAVLVPAGTRVTDSGSVLYWETEADAWIAAGETWVDALVRCQTAGTAGNGYAAGQINTIVDVYDYYSACSNITGSDGGTDEPTDDEFYALLRASMNAFSTAGPRGAYEYHARAVSTEIGDVLAVRPKELRTEEAPVYERSGSKFAFLGGDDLALDTLEVRAHGSGTAAVSGTDYTATLSDGLITVSITPGGALDGASALDLRVARDGAGRVDIYVLKTDGSEAGTELKDLVLAACNDRSVRPMCDLVSVKDPVSEVYNVDLTYYVKAGAASGAAAIAQAVSDAVEEYERWQTAKLGRDINPSYLIGLLMRIEGVKRVVVRSPTFTALRDGSDAGTPQHAIVGTTTIINGGVEDE